MNIKHIWTETLLDYWDQDVDGDVFAHVQHMVKILGYTVSRNQVRLEILNRLRRYGFAPPQGAMTPQQWQIARMLWREREFSIREMPNGTTRVWSRGELG